MENTNGHFFQLFNEIRYRYMAENVHSKIFSNFFKKSTSSRRRDLVPSGLWLFNEFGFGGRSELERQIKRSNTDRNQENKNIFPRKKNETKLVP